MLPPPPPGLLEMAVPSLASMVSVTPPQPMLLSTPVSSLALASSAACTCMVRSQMPKEKSRPVATVTPLFQPGTLLLGPRVTAVPVREAETEVAPNGTVRAMLLPATPESAVASITVSAAGTPEGTSNVTMAVPLSQLGCRLIRRLPTRPLLTAQVEVGQCAFFGVGAEGEDAGGQGCEPVVAEVEAGHGGQGREDAGGRIAGVQAGGGQTVAAEVEGGDFGQIGEDTAWQGRRGCCRTG